MGLNCVSQVVLSTHTLSNVDGLANKLTERLQFVIIHNLESKDDPPFSTITSVSLPSIDCSVVVSLCRQQQVRRVGHSTRIVGVDRQLHSVHLSSPSVYSQSVSALATLLLRSYSVHPSVRIQLQLMVLLHARSTHTPFLVHCWDEFSPIVDPAPHLYTRERRSSPCIYRVTCMEMHSVCNRRQPDTHTCRPSTTIEWQ